MGTVGKVSAAAAAAAVFVIGILVWILRPEDGSSPLEPDEISLPPERLRYVALGDSYSAGEGVKPFSRETVDLEDGGDRCHRSVHAYPLRLQFSEPVSPEHRACSGALVEHLYDSVQEHGRRPVRLGKQAEGQLGPDVGLVTLTVGGNDAGFSDVVKFCARNRGCVDDPYEGFDSLLEWADVALSDLSGRLPGLYQRLGQEADEARIIVVGYPKLFSDRTTARALCVVYETLFEDDERATLNELTMRLNRVIEGAATSAGLEYIELSYIFAGHETCAAGDAWLQFVSRNPRFQDGNFHPNRNGQTMIARTVACFLTIVRDGPDRAVDAPVAEVTVPPSGGPIEEVQQPSSAGAIGDLGDELYDCAVNMRTDDELDRRDPPLPELQDYGSPSPTTVVPASSAG